jgi:hypothetical protein
VVNIISESNMKWNGARIVKPTVSVRETIGLLSADTWFMIVIIAGDIEPH